MFSLASKIALLTVLLCSTAVLSRPKSFDIQKKKAELKEAVRDPAWYSSIIKELGNEKLSYDDITMSAESLEQLLNPPFDKYYKEVTRKHPEQQPVTDSDVLQLARELYDETLAAARLEIVSYINEAQRHLAKGTMNEEEMKEYKKQFAEKVSQMTINSLYHLGTVKKLILNKIQLK